MINPRTKSRLITLGLVVGVVLLAVAIILIKPYLITDWPADIVQCIGANSTLYVQKGCHACATQEDEIGKNKEFLNIIDCFYDKEKCLNITATPTW